ncbi:MAG TPA: transglutaminase-like domain-containing protein [Thermoanaerobaculia bacterium]|nr:transglutaminase-like domain-containing protein [Thermoanaerobaculia bacterium]
MNRFLAGFLAAMVAAAGAGGQAARYRGEGEASRLFDQYDNDGYSLAVLPMPGGGVELVVTISDLPLESRAPFPTGLPKDPTLTPAPEREAFVDRVVRDATTQTVAVERLLAGLAAHVRYDPDRVRRQDPAAVFRERRANCVGLSELAVDLLRRAAIRARTVQGVLKGEPGTPSYDAAVGGAYHRWIEIHYPDRGFVFSDPSASINGVDSRYLPFKKRAYSRPRGLRLTPLSSTGRLNYGTASAGGVYLRVRTAGTGSR